MIQCARGGFLFSCFFRPVEHFQFGRSFFGSPLEAVLVSRANEALEHGMRFQRLGLELRVELAADEMRVIRKFDHFHISSVRRRTGDLESSSGQCAFVFTVEFITVAMAFADLKLAIDLVGQSTRLDFAGPGAQSHGASQFFHAAQFAQLVNHPMRSSRVKLARIGLRQPANIPGKLDTRSLHAQTNTEIRDFFLASITNCNQHAFNAPLAEASGHENTVVVGQLFFVSAVAGFQSFRLNPVHMQLQIVGQRAVDQRLFQRLVGVFVLDVLADDANRDLSLRVIDAVNDVFPFREIAFLGFEAKVA